MRIASTADLSCNAEISVFKETITAIKSKNSSRADSRIGISWAQDIRKKAITNNKCNIYRNGDKRGKHINKIIKGPYNADDK